MKLKNKKKHEGTKSSKQNVMIEFEGERTVRTMEVLLSLKTSISKCNWWVFSRILTIAPKFVHYYIYRLADLQGCIFYIDIY